MDQTIGNCDHNLYTYEAIKIQEGDSWEKCTIPVLCSSKRLNILLNVRGLETIFELTQCR